MNDETKSDRPPPVDPSEYDDGFQDLLPPPPVVHVAQPPVQAGQRALSKGAFEADAAPPVDDSELISGPIKYCKNCKMAEHEHAKGGKCLYEPTSFEPDLNRETLDISYTVKLRKPMHYVMFKLEV